MSLHSLPVLTAEKMFQEDVRLMKCPKIIRLDGVRASATCDEPSQCTQKALDRLVRDEFQADHPSVAGTDALPLVGRSSHTCEEHQIHDHTFSREQSWEFGFLFQLSSAKTSTYSQDSELIQKRVETAQHLRHRFIQRLFRAEGVDLLLPDPNSLSFLQLIRRQPNSCSS
ncbi:hypothetical protein T4E_7055 [Trichinella pseudospiralis]|uniref:Uncharacterized protein n=1 Tax=Trichinella pseudospiralis TaxID=6337 RepID=A0A0V0XEM0_TRIPS|nr:hypothetical protein T4E_7055 [Trichinella pseudospiralis]